MEFKCSLCDYVSGRKSNIKTYTNSKCVGALINTLKIDIKCEFCNKLFTTKPILIKHLKTCKVKKLNLEEENKKLKEELEIEKKSVKNRNSTIIEYDVLHKKYTKLEESINSIIDLVDDKVLGNTNISVIRSQSRKKYRGMFNMNCVHCKHNGSTQVCHIKAISEFNRLSTIKEINHISNLIGLCPNCHIDLDKHKKFEVTRTAILHNMIMKKIKPLG